MIIKFAAALSLILSQSACPGGFWDSGNCCACLLRHEGDGTEHTVSDQTQTYSNCIPGDRSFNEENSICSNQMAEEMTGDGDPIELTAMSCVETVCADECRGVVESGVQFEVAQSE